MMPVLWNMGRITSHLESQSLLREKPPSSIRILLLLTVFGSHLDIVPDYPRSPKPRTIRIQLGPIKYGKEAMIK
jgi:hypothetical protein